MWLMSRRSDCLLFAEGGTHVVADVSLTMNLVHEIVTWCFFGLGSILYVSPLMISLFFLQKIREIQRCLDREPLVKVRNPSTVIKDYKVRFSLLIQTLFNSVSILLKQFLNDVHFMMRMNEVNRIDFRHSYFQFLRLEVGLRAQSAKMGSSPWWRVVVSLCQ